MWHYAPYFVSPNVSLRTSDHVYYVLQILSKRLQHYKLQKYGTNKHPCSQTALDYTQLQFAIRHEYIEPATRLALLLPSCIPMNDQQQERKHFSVQIYKSRTSYQYNYFFVPIATTFRIPSVTSIQTQASRVIPRNSPSSFTTQTSPTSRLTPIPAVIKTCIRYNSKRTEQLSVLLPVFQSRNSTLNILFPNYVQHPCHQHCLPNLDSRWCSNEVRWNTLQYSC
jgi:hypothetical protein